MALSWAMLVQATDKHTLTGNVTAKDINQQVLKNFTRDYEKATDIKWEKREGIYLAHFMLNDQSLVAAYNEEGNALSISRYISFADLPLVISMAIDKTYTDYQKTGSVIEVVSGNESYYYFTLAGNKKILRIKATANGNLEVTEKQKLYNAQ
jgi:hypothetical protein